MFREISGSARRTGDLRKADNVSRFGMLAVLMFPTGTVHVGEGRETRLGIVEESSLEKDFALEFFLDGFVSRLSHSTSPGIGFCFRIPSDNANREFATATALLLVLEFLMICVGLDPTARVSVGGSMDTECSAAAWERTCHNR